MYLTSETKTSTQGQRELSEAFLEYCLNRIHTGSRKTWKVMKFNNISFSRSGKSWNVIICLVDWLMRMSQQGQFKIEMNN